MQGGAEATLQAEVDRASTTIAKAWSRPPIEVDFQILMYTASGLLVRYLKVFERSNCTSALFSDLASQAQNAERRADPWRNTCRPKRQVGALPHTGAGLVSGAVLTE